MYKFLVSILIFIIGFVVTQRVLAWDHAVIMKPHEGAIYTVPVPLNPGVPNCVYVKLTDCKDAVYLPEELPSPAIIDNDLAAPAPPQEVSEMPTPGAYGWSFFDVMDRSEWAIEVDDEETSDSTKTALYKKEHAIDDDPTTIWHTRWVDPATPMPHWAKIDLGREAWVDSMIITPRPWTGPDCVHCVGSNVKGYEVWVSKDDNIWARVAAGELAFVEGAPQTIEFSIPNLVRYVRLDVLSASGDKPAVTLGDIQITESTKDIVITGGGM